MKWVVAATRKLGVHVKQVAHVGSLSGEQDVIVR